MTKRFYDKPYGTFSSWTDINITVVCPKCGKAGTVHFDRTCNRAYFHCESCYTKNQFLQSESRDVEVTAQCISTGKYFRTFVPKDKVRGQKIRVKCPYCEEAVIGDIQDPVKSYVVYQDICQAADPYFHYPLYFQGSYRGEIVWAINREHLQYLIDYLSADIRTVSFDFYETNGTMRSQSDMLPTFMKTAKNREGIVKLLTRLQTK